MRINLKAHENARVVSLRMTARSKKATHPRDNAKGRRKKENKELSDLASQLPLPVTVATQLDKASVIRLATAYLKLRSLFPRGLGKEWGQNCSTAVDMLPELGKFLNKAFHGFVFILGADATILYISEEASAQLGFSQVQLTGKNFWSYVHSSDAKELKTILCFEMSVPAFNVGSSIREEVEVPRSFTTRMKCILPKRQAELAVDRYKVIHCRGYLKLKRKIAPWDNSSRTCYEMTGFIASGNSLSPTPSAEIKLYRRDFMFRTSLTLQFLYIEPKSQKIIGFEPTQLQDKSLYKFIHPYDCQQMKQVHEMAVKKSQAISSYYRFLTRDGGWIWIQSSCIVITSIKADNGQCILFVNSVLSEREYPNSTLAVEQMAEEGNKQSNSTKRCRSSLKSRKKSSNEIIEDSSPNDRNSMNASPQQTPEIQGLVEVPLCEPSNAYYFNPTSGFLQQSNLCESLQVVNSPEMNNDRYTTSLVGSFNAHGLDEYTSLSNLESTINAVDFRRDCDAEFHACRSILHTSSSELGDSGISFENLEHSHIPSALSINSENEHVTFYASLASVSSTNLENYTFLNPATSIKGDQIYKLNQSNPTVTFPFTNLDSTSLKSSQDAIIQNCSSDSKLRVSASAFDSAKSSLNVIEDNDKIGVNSCNPPSLKDNTRNELIESNIATSSSYINTNNYNASLDTNEHMDDGGDFLSEGKVLCNNDSTNINSADSIRDSKNPYEISYAPGYDFCNSTGNQTFNRNIVYDDKYTGQFDVFVVNSNGVFHSKKILSDEKVNSHLTVSANPVNRDNLNNKTISDNGSTPMVTSTVEQPIIKNDNNNIFYVLNNLKCDTLCQTNHILTETFPASVKDSNIAMSHINTKSSAVAITFPTIATDDCSDELCTSYDLKNDTNFQVSTDTSSISSSIINIDRSRNSSTSHSLNNSSISISRKDSADGYTTVDNEYLTLLNDQWTAMYSQSATNARSDSVSSISLGYASESSYLDQSSPFSIYGESSYL